MSPKIWSDYPFDIQDFYNRRMVIVADNATPALVIEEAQRVDWQNVNYVHIACTVPALAFALGLALTDIQLDSQLAAALEVGPADGEMLAVTIVVNGTEITRAK